MFIKPFFRWIAVLPGALLAAIVAHFPWHWLVLFYAHFVGRPEGQEVLGLSFLVRVVGPETVERIGYGFLTPFVLITVAARIAPRFKQATAVVFSLMVVAIWGVLWLVSDDLLARQGENLEVIPTLIATFLAGVAIWVAFRYARPWWEGDVSLARSEKYELAIERADTLLNRGLYQEAIDAYDEAIIVNQKLAGVRVLGPYNSRGRAREELGQSVEAITDYDTAISLHPVPSNYLSRGLAYHRAGQHELAIRDFDSAIKIHPSYGQGYHARGLAYRELGNSIQAGDPKREAFNASADRDFQQAKELGYEGL